MNDHINIDNYGTLNMTLKFHYNIRQRNAESEKDLPPSGRRPRPDSLLMPQESSLNNSSYPGVVDASYWSLNELHEILIWVNILIKYS